MVAPVTTTTTTFNVNDSYNDSFEPHDGRSGTQTNDIITTAKAKEIAYGVLEEEVGRELTQQEKEEVDRLITNSDRTAFGGDADGKVDKAELKSVFANIEGATDLDIFTDVEENTRYNNLSGYSDLKKLGTDASNPARIIDNREDIASTSVDTQSDFNATSNALLTEVNIEGDYTKEDIDEAIIDGFGAYQKTQTPPDYSENSFKDYLELLATGNTTAKGTFTTALAALDETEPTDPTDPTESTTVTPEVARANLDDLNLGHYYDDLVALGATPEQINAINSRADLFRLGASLEEDETPA